MIQNTKVVLTPEQIQNRKEYLERVVPKEKMKYDNKFVSNKNNIQKYNQLSSEERIAKKEKFAEKQERIYNMIPDAGPIKKEVAITIHKHFTNNETKEGKFYVARCKLLNIERRDLNELTAMRRVKEEVIMWLRQQLRDIEEIQADKDFLALNDEEVDLTEEVFNEPEIDEKEEKEKKYQYKEYQKAYQKNYREQKRLKKQQEKTSE